MRVTETGTVLTGLGSARVAPLPASPGEKVVRTRQVVGLVLGILIIGAGLWGLLHVDAAERAWRESSDALTEGRPLDALEIIDAALREAPGDENLIANAVIAGSTYLDVTRENVGPAEALSWLQRELARRSYLEPLRERIPGLDALVTAGKIAADPGDKRWQLVRDLMNRYPDNPGIPYAAAHALEGKVYELFPISLYEICHKRNGLAVSPIRSKHFFDYCMTLFRTVTPGSESGKIAHRLLAEVLEQRSVEWALTVTDEDTSGRVFDNAWHILSTKGHPRTAEEHYRLLYELLDGYGGEEDSAAALRIFSAEEDPVRRERILALHRWVMNPDTSWSGSHRKLVDRNLKELEGLWKQ